MAAARTPAVRLCQDVGLIIWLQVGFDLSRGRHPTVHSLTLDLTKCFDWQVYLADPLAAAEALHLSSSAAAPCAAPAAAAPQPKAAATAASAPAIADAAPAVPALEAAAGAAAPAAVAAAAAEPIPNAAADQQAAVGPAAEAAQELGPPEAAASAVPLTPPVPVTVGKRKREAGAKGGRATGKRSGTGQRPASREAAALKVGKNV